MADLGDPKAALRYYLQVTRDDLIWKLDGLSEREARLPRTATGNNLLGVLKHCLNVEAGYFGPAFGQEFPTPDELVPVPAYEEDPQADWYALESETKEGLTSTSCASNTTSRSRSGTHWWTGGPVFAEARAATSGMVGSMTAIQRIFGSR
jgi:hypothetical protein